MVLLIMKSCIHLTILFGTLTLFFCLITASVGFVKGGGQVNRDGHRAFVPLEAFLDCLGNEGGLVDLLSVEDPVVAVVSVHKFGKAYFLFSQRGAGNTK
jgi:hypothetical protein